ncbi:MAG: hypothetical protein CMJ18_23580 [Phycisphaeraceae bacterium]|nr:hypothetical protein [Phycisphaeraceae bacterium]
MKLDLMATELGLESSLPYLRHGWADSQRNMSRPVPGFLDEQFVTEAVRGVNLPEETVQEACEVARLVAGNPALCALAWHCHWCLYHVHGFSGHVADQWPALEHLGQDTNRYFYLLVLLSNYPQMQEIHDRHALSEEVRDLTLEQILRRGRHCGAHLGGWGLDGHAARWLANTLRGDIYAIGRLVYEFRCFPAPFRVYRHERSRAVIMLCEAGLRFGADGQRVHGPGDDHPWTSRLAETLTEIVGHPVTPEGAAMRQEITLPTAEWRLLLQREDPVLSVHIPGGSPLDLDRCAKSFRDATVFFPRYFPDRPFSAFRCASWLLDTQLEDWLPPTANLVRFLREWYLLPGGIGAGPLLEAVFGGRPPDLAKAPRDTALQRAVLDHLSSGRPIRPRAGHGVIFPEDLDRGRQVYRGLRPHS